MLYAKPAEGFAAFPGPLPGNLTLRANRRAVRSLFGTPERSGETVTISGLGRQGSWDRFAVGETRVHFQYTLRGELIQRISIMVADMAP